MKYKLLVLFMLVSSTILRSQVMKAPNYLKLEEYKLNYISKDWIMTKFETVDFIDTLASEIHYYIIESNGDTTYDMHELYSYNSHNLPIQFINLTYYGDNFWDTVVTQSYVYDRFYHLIEYYSNSKYTVWKIDYLRNTYGEIDTMFYIRWNSDRLKWDTTQKTEYTWLEPHKTSKIKEFIPDSSSKNYLLTSEFDNTFDSNGKIIEVYSYEDQNTNTPNSYKTAYFYDSLFEKQLTSRFYFMIDGTWDLSYEIIQKYDENNLEIFDTATVFSNNNVVATGIKQYFYENHKLTVIGTSSNSELNYKLIYYYPDFSNIAYDLINTNYINAFPNPAAPGENITISYPDIKNGMASVSITNLQGETVFAGSTSVVDSKMTIAAPNLSSGMYFVNIMERNGKIGQTKLMISK